MPSLVVHIGFSAISYKLSTDSSEEIFGYFPYTYIEPFNFSFSRSEYLKAVIERVLAHHSVDGAGCKIAYTHGLEQALSQTRSLGEFTPILLDSWLCVTPSFYSCSVPINTLNDLEYRVSVNYPNTLPQNLHWQLKRDALYVDLLKEFTPATQAVLLTGDRFVGLNLDQDKEYISYFAASLLHKDGVYDIYIDNANKFMLTNAGLGSFVHFATIFSQNKELECLLTSELGTKQLVTVEKGGFFTLQADDSQKTTALLKFQGGKSEEYALAGSKNFIFDCRAKDNLTYADIHLFEGTFL